MQFYANGIRNTSSSTDEGILRWDGTTGNLVQDCTVCIDDSCNITGINNITTTGDLKLGSNKELRFYEGVNYIGFKAPALGANKIWILPATDGGLNEVLTTDGSGNLSWSSAGGADTLDDVCDRGSTTDQSIGIGVDPPAATLDVVGATYPVLRSERSVTGNYDTLLNTCMLKLTTTGTLSDGAGPSFQFVITDSSGLTDLTGAISYFGGYRDGADNTGGILFGTYNAGVAGSKMWLDHSGNLGIGDVPSYKLHVVGNAYIGGTIGIGIAPWSGAELYVLGPSGSTTVRIEGPNNQDARFQLIADSADNDADYFMIIKKATGNKVFFQQVISSAWRTDISILSSGEVGIGTETPNQLLTVEGTVDLKEQASANADTAAYGQFWVKNTTPNEPWFTDDAGNDILLKPTREFFVPPTYGTGAHIESFTFPVWSCIGASGEYVNMYFHVPADFTSLTQVVVTLISTENAYVAVKSTTNWGPPGGAPNQRTGSTGPSQFATVANRFYEHDITGGFAAGLTAGDHVGVRFGDNGTNGNNKTFHVVGLYFRYK